MNIISRCVRASVQCHKLAKELKDLGAPIGFILQAQGMASDLLDMGELIQKWENGDDIIKELFGFTQEIKEKEE